MSGTEDDSRCQKAVRIITELCRKKSLPALHLNTCREFLLASDQSLSISEPGTVLWSCELGTAKHPKQGNACTGGTFGSSVLELGENCLSTDLLLFSFMRSTAGAGAD